MNTGREILLALKPLEGDFKAQLAKNAAFLNSARPTAVNLSWALERMNAVATEHAQADTGRNTLHGPGVVQME